MEKQGQIGLATIGKNRGRAPHLEVVIGLQVQLPAIILYTDTTTPFFMTDDVITFAKR